MIQGLFPAIITGVAALTTPVLLVNVRPTTNAIAIQNAVEFLLD
jgi:hypothetical protein